MELPALKVGKPRPTPVVRGGITADWKPEKEPNMDEEIELIKKWVKEREDFINE